MKIAAIIPVKTFSNAKTRLQLPPDKVEALCKIMLEEILQVLSISPKIEKIIMITKEEKAIEIGKKFNTIIIIDEKEEGVNQAVVLADKYLLENIKLNNFQNITSFNYALGENIAQVNFSDFQSDGQNRIVNLNSKLIK